MSAVVRPTSRRTAAPPRLRLRRLLRLIVRYSLLSLILVFAVFPFVWTLAIALTDKSATGGVSIYDFPASLLPRQVTLNNFVEVYRTFSLGKYVWNSVVITGMTVLGTLAVSSLAAYPLARFRFPGRNALFALIIATLVLPSETNFIVNTLTLQKLHLLGTYTGVVLPGLATAFGIFLMRQAFLAVPHSLIEAARLDGASEWQTLWRVMLPLTTPSLAALGIFTLVTSWNAYFWPQLVLSATPDLAPLSVAVLKLKGQFNYDPFNVAAGSLIMMLPVLLIFMAAQRYFMRGLEGAVK
ncbi:carbohydrate ABC transporter permease [Deinococcus peraridilitoris]|uniref:ABC-type sugar transport system, permease component n=1 Tax=Deinococcus peraridilitoris (strain DSM 19664 / LMG 22246 / CIP 109416 / KR-200) TaxID=937777 RepID=L0A0Q2_DEIPD|nr:carbohydrate ABC transporter permease [Deinococcus peraridilitoris]AFZ66747.1 ABC-type sugar transport system, permease component [Deinococcus peraridilitoris DSM 19664]